LDNEFYNKFNIIIIHEQNTFFLFLYSFNKCLGINTGYYLNKWSIKNLIG